MKTRKNEPKLARLYRIRFYGPTNTKNARVAIIFPHGTKLVVEYDYKIGSMLEQGLHVLEGAGIDITSYGELNDKEYFAIEELE